ncbi:saccharopine dehydrogenase family protein [Pollutibacter soli]|uniref:saccharopine dehydrogenase family protein n=1 Tax=Pollutibacter soli TaxID=3034157 RepID=UPI0030134C31
MKIAVLGAGLVGSVIARDLSAEYDVTAFDIDAIALGSLNKRFPKINVVTADLKDYNNYKKMLDPFDLVVTAVPGFMGYETLKAVIRCGKSVADISFSPEDVLNLDAEAKANNCTVITDCGVAPGISNFIIGRYNEFMEIDAFEIYVGGLPEIRKKPFEYKAPFSPVDVIEEYTRPARFLENGVIVVKKAMSETELMDFDGIGTLEAFNTDGLRSLLTTMPHIKNQKEKTLRYPGHAALIIALQQGGFFDKEEILIRGQKVSPLEVTSKILFKEWKLDPEEAELTVLKIILKGKINGKPETVVYNLLDRYHEESGVSSMSRTTGYTCTATANIIARGIFKEKGVFAPESVGKHKESFDYLMQYLDKREIHCKKEAAG